MNKDRLRYMIGFFVLAISETMVLISIFLFSIGFYIVNLMTFAWCFITKLSLPDNDSSAYIAVLVYTIIYAVLLLLIDKLLQKMIANNKDSILINVLRGKQIDLMGI